MSYLYFQISGGFTLAAAPLDEHDRVSQIPLDIPAYLRKSSVYIVYNVNGNVTPRPEGKQGLAEHHYIPTLK